MNTSSERCHYNAVVIVQGLKESGSPSEAVTTLCMALALCLIHQTEPDEESRDKTLRAIAEQLPILVAGYESQLDEKTIAERREFFAPKSKA